MVSATVKIEIPEGLHLRPAGKICEVASRFDSKITFTHGSLAAVTNAKSVLSVLAAGVKFGDEITLTCEGPDEEEAMAKLLPIFGNE